MMESSRWRASSSGLRGPRRARRHLHRRPATARSVAAELTARDALDAHLDAELHIDPDDIASPAQAASASALSFVSGAVLPLLAILLPPAGLRVVVTFVAVLVALALTAPSARAWAAAMSAGRCCAWSSAARSA